MSDVTNREVVEYLINFEASLSSTPARKTNTSYIRSLLKECPECKNKDFKSEDLK